MNSNGIAVFVVDDDEAVRDSLCLVLSTNGFACRMFENAEAFLDSWKMDWRGVVLLDLKMPGLDGLELQQKLIEQNCPLPIIFVSGHGTIPDAVMALRQGATHFLEKPYNEANLLRTIREALSISEGKEEERQKSEHLAQQLADLTPREREVLDHILSGETNRESAEKLGISARTVEVHRSHIMDKLEAKNAVELAKRVLGER